MNGYVGCGLTISDDGGLEELEEFFSSRAILSSRSIMCSRSCLFSSVSCLIIASLSMTSLSDKNNVLLQLTPASKVCSGGDAEL